MCSCDCGSVMVKWWGKMSDFVLPFSYGAFAGGGRSGRVSWQQRIHLEKTCCDTSPLAYQMLPMFLRNRST
jgi:hypothetical protein